MGCECFFFIALVCFCLLSVIVPAVWIVRFLVLFLLFECVGEILVFPCFSVSVGRVFIASASISLYYQRRLYETRNERRSPPYCIASGTLKEG